MTLNSLSRIVRQPILNPILTDLLAEVLENNSNVFEEDAITDMAQFPHERPRGDIIDDDDVTSNKYGRKLIATSCPSWGINFVLTGEKLDIPTVITGKYLEGLVSLWL